MLPLHIEIQKLTTRPISSYYPESKLLKPEPIPQETFGYTDKNLSKLGEKSKAKVIISENHPINKRKTRNYNDYMLMRMIQRSKKELEIKKNNKILIRERSPTLKEPKQLKIKRRSFIDISPLFKKSNNHDDQDTLFKVLGVNEKGGGYQMILRKIKSQEEKIREHKSKHRLSTFLDFQSIHKSYIFFFFYQFSCKQSSQMKKTTKKIPL